MFFTCPSVFTFIHFHLSVCPERLIDLSIPFSSLLSLYTPTKTTVEKAYRPHTSSFGSIVEEPLYQYSYVGEKDKSVVTTTAVALPSIFSLGKPFLFPWWSCLVHRVWVQLTLPSSLAGPREGHVTHTWPIRARHLLSQKDWLRDAHVSQVGPLRNFFQIPASIFTVKIISFPLEL